jgi:putative DNA-invertase from lambdoid prophage Rac
MRRKAGEAVTRVFAYVRASTSKQVESPETQRGIIEAYCRRHELEISGFYVDPAKSGALPMLQRPAGREMLKAMGTGDVVVIARLDRISRSFIDFGRILESFAHLDPHQGRTGQCCGQG